MLDFKAHWDHIYASKEINTLGWYEPTPQVSLDLIEELKLDPKLLIIDVGCGLSYLADNLLDKGYQNLILTDLSKIALEIIESRLRNKWPIATIQFIQDDLSKSEKVRSISKVKLWHDRAVLHFLTNEEQRQSYVRTLKKVLIPGGFVILAEFSENGALKCSGLEVHRYSTQELSRLLGNDFRLIKSLDHTYVTPSGADRPYVYSVWQRQS